MKRGAFTLAEVLITLGIIGIIAAITLPILVKNYQQSIINQQFKRVYSQLSNALVMVENVAGYKPACNDDVNGLWSKDCYMLRDILYKQILPVAKSCEGNALQKGCLPKGGYKGRETILNPDATEEEIEEAMHSSCRNFTKQIMETENYVYVMNDGTIYMLYGTQPGILAVDVNGYKKPNKWGYDLFSFYLKTDFKKPIYLPAASDSCAPVEKGGKNTRQMFDEIY